MGCSFYRRERNHLSATDAWREAAVGDSRYMCIRTASFEGSVSKQMVVTTEKRLARVLLLLANFGKEGRTEPIQR
jgi:hypothetical protein